MPSSGQGIPYWRSWFISKVSDVEPKFQSKGHLSSPCSSWSGLDRWEAEDTVSSASSPPLSVEN